MSSRTLDTDTIVVDNNLVISDHPMGYQIVMRGSTFVCDDSSDTQARAYQFAIEAGPLAGKTVAWIGGGLCVGPNLFQLSNPTQTIYEIEAELDEFCLPPMTFVPGDYNTTLTGLFDLIVYDIPGELATPTTLFLSDHLAPGGEIIVVE